MADLVAKATEIGVKLGELQALVYDAKRRAAAGDALRSVAIRVLSYWDYMDAVPADDARPTETFKAEMDARMGELRAMLNIPESPRAEAPSDG